MVKPHRIPVFLLLGLALTVRLAVWYAYLQHPDAFVQPDTVTYLAPGERLLEDGAFPSFARTPIYPVFLAAVSKVVSSNPAVIALVQIIVSLATVALMFYVAGAAFGMSAAIVALLFMGRTSRVRSLRVSFWRTLSSRSCSRPQLPDCSEFPGRTPDCPRQRQSASVFPSWLCAGP